MGKRPIRGGRIESITRADVWPETLFPARRHAQRARNRRAGQMTEEWWVERSYWTDRGKSTHAGWPEVIQPADEVGECSM